MNEALKKILESEVLTDETKQAVTEAFKKVLEEAKQVQENALRAEYADRYERDKVKIAEAVEQFVNERTEKHVTEMQEAVQALQSQRLKYVNAQAALSEKAKEQFRQKLQVLHAFNESRWKKEIAELHEEMKTNRKAVLKTIAENNARAAAERQTFKDKAAAVLHHIHQVQMPAEFGRLREDIKAAKENDFGRRIFEAFIGEARRSFFNASAAHKELVAKIATMESAHKKALGEASKKLAEANAKVENTTRAANKLKESATRIATMNRLLGSVPNGAARDKMKQLLEASSTAHLESTFKKFAPQVLSESRTHPAPTRTEKLNFEVRTGNGKLVEAAVVGEDDDEIVTLRRRAAINENRARAGNK